jgi:hypothetical protein
MAATDHQYVKSIGMLHRHSTLAQAVNWPLRKSRIACSISATVFMTKGP